MIEIYSVSKYLEFLEKEKFFPGLIDYIKKSYEQFGESIHQPSEPLLFGNYLGKDDENYDGIANMQFEWIIDSRKLFYIREINGSAFEHKYVFYEWQYLPWPFIETKTGSIKPNPPKEFFQALGKPLNCPLNYWEGL